MKEKSLLIISIVCMILMLILLIFASKNACAQETAKKAHIVTLSNKTLDYNDCRMFHNACRWDCRIGFVGQGWMKQGNTFGWSYLRECSNACVQEYFKCKEKVLNK